MPVMNQGPSTFDGVSAIKLTANMSQITITDSPDERVHTEKTNGAVATNRQEGSVLKVTGNMAHIELKVPPGVDLNITNNLSTIIDERSAKREVSTAPQALESLKNPTPASVQSFPGVSTIDLVNQLGTVEIHKGEPGSPTKVHYNGTALIDQEGGALDVINRGGVMTIITPDGTKVNHTGHGTVVDKRFE